MHMPEKEDDTELTIEESPEVKSDIKKFAHLILEIALEDIRRKEILITKPKGFLFDKSGYCCLICGQSAPEGNSWYDKYGLKCMSCQKAVNDKIIPRSVAMNKGSWYSKSELEMYFNIKGTYLNKLIKLEILKYRIIQNSNGKVHFQLFLIKDNKNVLPPKKFLKSRTVKVIRNGEEWFTEEYWYEFMDLDLLNRLLVKYKIFTCLKESFAKPMNNGRFYWQKTSPIFNEPAFIDKRMGSG
jgi:hypothetical protein